MTGIGATNLLLLMPLLLFLLLGRLFFPLGLLEGPTSRDLLGGELGQVGPASFGVCLLGGLVDALRNNC